MEKQDYRPNQPRLTKGDTEMTDFSYSITENMYAVYANTDQAALALSQIMAQNQNSIKFFKHEFQSLKRQVRAAGYSISREKQSKMSADELLAALNA